MRDEEINKSLFSEELNCTVLYCTVLYCTKKWYSHLLNEQDGGCINLKADRYSFRAVNVFTRALS